MIVIGVLAVDCATFASDVTSADSRMGVGDPARGEQKLQVEMCQACHGPKGRSESDIVPSLFGQFAPYIIKELQDFRSGRRTDPLMSRMAEDVSDATIVDIAAYFASLPPIRFEQQEPGSPGARLFLHGEEQSHIPACSSCHGVDAAGTSLGAMAAPALFGQPRVYLRYQLLKWRAGDRTNDPTATMPNIARALSSTQIDQLARFLSGEE